MLISPQKPLQKIRSNSFGTDSDLSNEEVHELIKDEIR
jgi:hypothetical protein